MRRMMLIGVTLMLAATTVHAEEPPYRIGAPPESYLLGGLTVGRSFGDAGRGGFLGAELSTARVQRLWWYGVYIDGAYDFGHGATTVTAGPEFGWGPLGVDGGGGVRWGLADDAEIGAQGRVMLTFGVFGIFVRYSIWPESPNERVAQVGALLKVPFWNGTPVPADAR